MDRATVPEDKATAFWAPTRCLNASWKASTAEPRGAIQPELTTRYKASASLNSVCGAERNSLVI